jgi:hypothetical protein
MAGQKPASKSTASALPKTSWGDPDLQGTWSGDSAFAIPMQRPEALGVKAELTDQELADKVARDEQARKRALGAVGSFRNDGAWLDKTFRQTSSRSTPDPTSASGFRPIWAIHAATGRQHPGGRDDQSQWKTNYSAVNMTLVERFTRVEADVLHYEAIVDDPTTYTARVRISIPFTSPPGYQVLPMTATRAIWPCCRGSAASAPRTRRLPLTRRAASCARGGPFKAG